MGFSASFQHISPCQQVLRMLLQVHDFLRQGADGLDGGSGATAASLFEDDFEALKRKS